MKPYTRADLLTAWPTLAEALRPKTEARPRASSNLPTTPTPGDLAERILETALHRYSATGTRHEGSKWLACQCLWNNVPRDEAEGLAERYAKSVHEPFDADEALELVAWAYSKQPPGEPWQPPQVKQHRMSRAFRSCQFGRLRRWL